MYYAPGEHSPPHFHAYYNEYKATFSIETLELTQGELPRRQLRLVQAWAELHEDELRGMGSGLQYLLFKLDLHSAIPANLDTADLTP